MYQKIIIIGNLGKDPDMRYTADGKPVTTFSVATSRKYGDVTETTWWRITTWNAQAENCNKFLTKGSRVFIEGHLTPDENGGPKVYQRKDGTWGASYDVTADLVKFIGGVQQVQEEDVAW